ncbi:MAG: hypothetical protein QOG87_3621 [Actinomycetota bacterium]
MVVVSSKGGRWLEGAEPVDRDALVQALQDADASIDGSPPPTSEDEQVTLTAGRIDWDGRSGSAAGEVDQATVSGDGSVRPATEGLGSVVSVNLKVRPRRMGWRWLLAVSGPLLGPFVRMMLRRQRDQIAKEMADIGRIAVPHRGREWRFEPD